MFVDSFTVSMSDNLKTIDASCYKKDDSSKANVCCYSERENNISVPLRRDGTTQSSTRAVLLLLNWELWFPQPELPSRSTESHRC